MTFYNFITDVVTQLATRPQLLISTCVVCALIFAIFDGQKKLTAPVSIRDLKLLTPSGFKRCTVRERFRILISCLWTVPILGLVTVALGLYTFFWSVCTLFSPMIDSMVEDPEDALARKNREEYGMVDVKQIDPDSLDLPHDEYDIYILNTVLMGVTGKLGKYAEENCIYHSGIGFISKDGTQEVALDLSVHAGFTNCLIPDFDLGIILFPPGFRSHVQFMNQTDISFYEVLDRNYWKKFDRVGSCNAQRIREFVQYSKSYRESHSYNLVGVGVFTDDDTFKDIIESDTCIAFVDHAMDFFKEGIDRQSLRKISEAEYFWVVNSESDYTMLDHQTTVVADFFKNLKADVTNAVLNSNGDCLPRDVFLSVMRKLTERLPCVSWYADVAGKGQVFYQLNHPTLRHRIHKWTILDDDKLIEH